MLEGIAGREHYEAGGGHRRAHRLKYKVSVFCTRHRRRSTSAPATRHSISRCEPRKNTPRRRAAVSVCAVAASGSHMRCYQSTPCGTGRGEHIHRYTTPLASPVHSLVQTQRAKYRKPHERSYDQNARFVWNHRGRAKTCGRRRDPIPGRGYP